MEKSVKMKPFVAVFAADETKNSIIDFLKKKKYDYEIYKNPFRGDYCFLIKQGDEEINFDKNLDIRYLKLHKRGKVYFTLNSLNYMLKNNIFVNKVDSSKIDWRMINNMFYSTGDMVLFSGSLKVSLFNKA